MKALGYILIGLAAAYCIYFLLHGLPQLPSPHHDVVASDFIVAAQTQYEAGEKATSIAERKHAFNKALATYMQLAKRYHPEYGNGKLYYNLANANYQLEQYPWAVYYYYKALKLMPEDEATQHNLEMVLKKLNLPNPTDKSLLHQVFFFHYYLTLPQKLMLFFLIGCVTFLFASLLIWKHWPGLKLLSFLSTLAWLLIFGSLMYSRYLAPVEGVVIRSAMLYRDAGVQYAQVSDKPVPAGAKVTVLDVRQQGSWLKVLTPDGTLGYATAESVRVL